MAREERSSRTWISMVTLVWVVFGLAVVGLILWYGGIIGGTPGNGDVTAVTQEDGNGNGADDADAEADANGNGEENGDAEADAGGNGDTEADASDNGSEAEEGNGNGEEQVAVFTSEQAERGQESYSQNCAQCHGGQLDGDPPLTGGDFASTWEGMPVNALFEVISQTMPQDAPGSLDAETYEDVTAHILAFNGMQDGDSELQAGDDESMETLINFDSDTDDTGDAVADENGDEAAADDAAADNGAAEEEQAAAENGTDAGADADNGNGDAEEAAVEDIEVQETADGQPAAGEGWIDLSVEPESATVNVLGPAGFTGQLQGTEGTITGLEPGSYVFTASLGNFSHRVDAQVRAHETVAVNLLIAELAGSPDLGGQQTEQQNGEEDGASADAGNGNGEDGQNGSEENGAANGEANGNDSDNGEAANGGNGNGENDNGSNGNDAWYTDEQADAGAEDYSASCASCHGEDGTGGSDPPLADGALEGSFETVWDLFDYTSTEMPDDDPGGLDEETYVNITAHLLALNDYSSGDEELEADEDQMSDMSLSNGDGGNGNGNGNGNGEDADTDANDESADQDSADANGEDAETNGESADQDSADANGEDAETNGEATEGTSAERGASLYSSNCAMCHGRTLHGVDAPPLAGPVFMERWGGHPVEWLYFQAHTSMPPDTPGSLDDQAYVDIIVHVLAENGILEGDEEFVPDDLLLRSMIIGTTDQQDGTLQNRIEELRRTVHEPFEEAEAEDPEAGAEEIGVPDTDAPQEATDEPENGEDAGNGDNAENGENGAVEENGDDEGTDGVNGNGNGNGENGNGNDNGDNDEGAEADKVYGRNLA